MGWFSNRRHHHQLAGVFFLKAGSWNTAKMHANNTEVGTYHYSFDYESDDSMFRWLFMGAPQTPFRAGVTHSDELMYLFSFPAIMEGHQVKVMDRMVKMWTNFAIYGYVHTCLPPPPHTLNLFMDLSK